MSTSSSSVSIDAAALTAAQILAIPPTQPERLYSGDAGALEKEYRELAKKWHPDRNKAPNANDVFAHVGVLHEKAKTYLENGIWNRPGLLELVATGGKKYLIRYLKKHDFELGEMYIGSSHIAFCVKPEFKDLFQNAEKTIKGFRYADSKMREEAGHFLPSIKASFTTSDRHVLVVNKGKDFVLLSDLLTHLGDKLDPKHTAWVLSRLHNICCYLQWTGLTHNAIATDTVLVSPAEHSAALLGGWWYAAAKNATVRAIPTRTLDLAPPDFLTRKKADPRVDHELLRATGRELLGDPIGSTLKWNSEIPRPFAEWLSLPASGDAVRDYRDWMESVLPKSFGPRRFVPMNVTPAEVYPQP